MIEVIKNFDKAGFVTHAGKFHADEVFATVLLEKIYENIKLIRLPEVDEYNLDGKVVYDIGGGKYDHHQLGGNGKRASGIRYAAFGLLWKELGREHLKNLNVDCVDDCFNMFDKNFVQFVDAGDNGQIPFENISIKLQTLSDVIEGFNPNWNEDIDADVKFKEAIEVARVIFDNKIESVIAKCRAKKCVEKAIEESKDGIIILEKFMPYEEFVLESDNPRAKDILYAVFKSNRGGYNVKAIPKTLGSFQNRKKMPKEWAGLRNEDLQKVTGVETATFCHNAGFICVAKTFDDAIKLAKIAVESN